jgi:hypothetical protein
VVVSPDTPIFNINITEILLKVALNSINREKKTLMVNNSTDIKKNKPLPLIFTHRAQQPTFDVGNPDRI